MFISSCAGYAWLPVDLQVKTLNLGNPFFSRFTSQLGSVSGFF